MRKALLLAALLLCLPVWSEAQSCDGCGIGYRPSSVSTSGGTLTGPLLLPDGGVAAPSLAFASDSVGDGWANGGAASWALAQSGVARFLFTGADLRLSSVGQIGFSSNTSVLAAVADTVLVRDAANTLALRNGGTTGTPVPQTFNVYNFCDGAACATGYENGKIYWIANSFRIATDYGGTGVGRVISIAPTGLVKWTFGTTEMYPGTTDAYDNGTASLLTKSLFLTRSIQGSKTFALTDGAAAAAFVRIAVPQTVDSNFAGGDVIWTATAKDATPHVQALSGRLKFSAVNNAGTEVCAVDPTAAVTAPNANSSGTLSCTMSCASNAADTVDLMATCDTSFGTPTGLTLYYRLDMPKTQTITPQ